MTVKVFETIMINTLHVYIGFFPVVQQQIVNIGLTACFDLHKAIQLCFTDSSVITCLFELPFTIQLERDMWYKLLICATDNI